MYPLEVYACYSLEQNIRLKSSSGAIFSFLAKYILEQEGVIYGVSMSDDCYSANFIRVVDDDGLAKLRGSKYLQAKVGNTYKQVKEDLLEGTLVLFSGTGCQINGLKGFLGREYDNLICVDVICHGVPSPVLWKKYAQYQEDFNGGKLKNINFRCKDQNWSDFGMKELLNNNSNLEEKKIYISKDKDSYMQMFLRNYCLRPSCYQCVAKNIKLSDLTIADFWGIDEVAPEMNDGKGTSLVLVRTQKGKLIFDKVSKSLRIKSVSYAEGVKCNPSEYQSCHKPIQREYFFTDMCNMTFEELEKKYASPIRATVWCKIKRKIKSWITRIPRKIGGAESNSNEKYGLFFVFRV